MSEKKRRVVDKERESLREPARLLRKHYSIGEKLADGSYGCVYKGTRLADGETVAIKAFTKHVRAFNSGFQLSSLRDITTALSLSHPALIKGYEVCVDPDIRPLTAYLIMEYADHELGVLLKNKHNFSLSERKCLAIQLVSGVDYLNNKARVVHRDLKPGNLLYKNSGHLKICDFGTSRKIAEAREEEEEDGSKAVTVKCTGDVGTLWYESPESLMGKQDWLCLGKTDIWSLGCVLYDILVSPAAPLFSSCETKDEMIRAMTLGLYKACFADSECESLLSKILTLDPEDRLDPADILNDPYFKSSKPLPQNVTFMPSINSSFITKV